MEEENVISGPPVFCILLANINKSLSQYLVDVSKEYEDHPFMVDVLTGKELKIKDAFHQSYKLAAELKSLGCKPGQVVGIISENRIEVPVAILAVLHVGATLTCFNPAYSKGELEHTLKVSDPYIIFASGSCYGRLAELVEDKMIPISTKYIICFDLEKRKPNALSYRDCLKNSSPANYVPPDIYADSTAVILFSSGSSGLPKGVMLTHMSFNFLLNLKRYNVKELIGEEQENTLSVIPMFHGYGIMLLFGAMCVSETIFSLAKFEERAFLHAISKYKITSLSLVPPLMLFLAKHPMVQEYDLTSVKKILCGAAPLSSDIENQVTDMFGLDRLIKSYGMTETTVVCTSSLVSNVEGSCGKLLPGFLAKIVDIESGKAVPLMKEGEICIKSPFLMKGYYRNEPETKAAFDKDGWLHTGDVGYFDEEEHLFIVDRIKDLIKYKGFQVAPAELEGLLLKYPAVKEAAVIGVPDEIAGELPKAFVVKQPNIECSASEIIKYVNDQVAPHMKLRGGLVFVDEIPKNQTGKILRRELRKFAQSKI